MGLEYARAVEPAALTGPNLLIGAVTEDAAIRQQLQRSRRPPPQVPGVCGLVDRADMPREDRLAGGGFSGAIVGE